MVQLRISPGNLADITQTEALLSQLRGLVVADAAYVSAKLREKLWELGLLLLTSLRKNMKGLASLEQTERLKGRSIIETVFSVLKDRLGLVTSLPRSRIVRRGAVGKVSEEATRWRPTLPHVRFLGEGVPAREPPYPPPVILWKGGVRPVFVASTL
jgi:hypothetical protein